MARSIWTGAISFGLVTVPVKLYSSVNRKTVRFHQLSGKSGVRIAQKRVDPSTGDEVAYDDIVKGFELTPDRYVVIEPGELETLQPKKTKTIEIEDFVELSEIDPIFYDHPYYLAPGTGGAKPYRLLVDAMRETDRVAIARVVIRSKEALVAVRPMGDHVLGMSTMLFPDEIVDPDSIDEISATAEVDVDQARARHRQAARRVARRPVRVRQVPRHLPPGGPRPHRAQGGRRGDRRAAGRRRGRGAGPRPHGRAEGQPRRGARQGRRRGNGAGQGEEGAGQGQGQACDAARKKAQSKS